MKVIPVAGLSGSGKTTFIRALLPVLSGRGPVGVVKHIGHHAMELPEEKDTTVLFGEGAEIVAGIDGEKTILTSRSTSLAGALGILSGAGMGFAVVEGYKSGPWPKIVVGHLDTGGVVLRNPSPEEVLRSLDRFPDYFTIGELLRELTGECREEVRPCVMASEVIPLPAGNGENELTAVEKRLPVLIKGIGASTGVVGVIAAVNRGSLFGGADEILVVVAAGDADGAASALQKAAGRITRALASP